ncbi:MAG: PAS domain-containing protein, partial [Proteobacteria bacterium]|nr:PAS domain-containing protein [Pseudomonadota bacterium]
MAKAGIMIVEDELIVCEDLKTHLQTMGYDVVATADSAEEAIVKAEKSKPDIVLMDIQLSGSMDGIEAADIIRSRWNIPIVFLTAYDNDDNLKRARHTLPFGYLLKPVQERELKVAIEMALFAAKTESERKQAEEALRQSEEKYRTLAENLPDFISRYDHSGRHVYVSPNIVRPRGKSVEEFMGKTHDELEYPGEQAALWDQQVRDLFETGEPQELDFFYEGPQGIRWLNWRLVPEYDALGNVVYALGITRDDTDRKQTEEKAQRQGEFLVRVTNSLVHPFYIIDAETYEILYANEASRKNKPLGETPKCYELLHRRSEPCQEAGRVCPLDRVRQTQEAVSTEHIDYDKGGNPRNIEIHASPIFDDDGNVIQIIMNAIDITKRRQAEEK